MVRVKTQLAFEPYSRQKLLLNRFQAMSEADFTRSVLVPLFAKMGFEVDEHGGFAEGGKDLICSRNGDFSFREIVVVQVKKTTPSAAASKANSFAGIVNQLQQASEQEVCTKSGERRRPNGIYFVTPYQLDARALESRFEAYRELATRRIRVLDGVSIVEELLRLLPSLADDLCGEDFTIKHNLLSNVSNADLLSALNYRQDRDIHDFYCDLDFGVGRVTSKLFFSLDVNPTSRTYSVHPKRWTAIEDCVQRIKAHTGVDVICSGTESVNLSYLTRYGIYNAKENQEILAKVRSTIFDIELLIHATLEQCREMVGDTTRLVTNQTIFEKRTTLRKVIPKFTEEETERLGQLKLARSHIEKSVNTKRICVDSVEWVELKAIIRAAEGSTELVSAGAVMSSSAANRLTSFFRSINLLNKLFEVLFDDHSQLIPEPEFDFVIDGSALAAELLNYQRTIALGLEQLAKQTLSQSEIKNFLVRCQDIFALVGVILDEKSFVDALGFNTTQAYAIAEAPQRLTMPIKDIFSTGIHCAVFGEAGAGKSTTLYRYAAEASKADGQDEITLFLPLTRVLSKRQGVADDDTIKPVAKLEAALANFLNVRNNATEAEILQFLKAKKRVTFIFDGVDEVIKSSPWIVDAIHALSERYPNSQEIISARSSGRYLDDTNFLCFTLLPFTPEQVKFFIERWFKQAPELARQVTQHLNITPALGEIVTNPLLATVLCVLAENGVPLPKGELGMYSERMRLLLGHYDIHKQSKRISTHHSILEATAKKLAYHLHSNNLRSMSRQALEKVAISSLGRGNSELTSDQLLVAVAELIDPCNVLQPMNDDGAFGFGHLRFQEYLCATELCTNRGIELMPLLSSPWWRSVVVLFGRMTDDIRYIIEDVIAQHHNVSKYRETLLAVIATRPTAQQNELTRLIDLHFAMDKVQLDLKEFSDYEDELDEYDDYKRY
jgi:hypothetical protein